MRIRKLSSVCSILFLIVGCDSTIHKTVDIDSGKGLSIDAKQRLILVSNSGGRGSDRRIVCAEPSPDALVAASVAASVSAGTPKFGLGLAASQSEAAASIGLRTQTIQLLRDGYYRICEAYMNGAFSREQYIFALTNIDKVMIPLLAIDTIAGTPRPPAVVISPGIAGTSTSVSLSNNQPSNGEATTAALSLGADSSVESTETSLVMESISQSRVGLNKEEARVLEAAIKGVHKDSFATLCLSYLTDSAFLAESALGGKLAHKVKLADSCNELLANKVKLAELQTQKALADVNMSLSKTKIALDNTKQKLNNTSAALKAEKAAHLKTMTDTISYSKDISMSATKYQNVIFTNGVKK